jgi:hypothetical protein
MPVLAVYAAGAYLGGAIGTAVGVSSVLGVSAAAIGGSLATMAYNSYNQPGSAGPRLSDLKAAQVSYGSVIPYVEGHPRVAGVIVWASVKRELESTSGGKGGGGGEFTSYTYEQDIMVMLSENMVGGVRKIWKNGELVWTRANDGDAASVANEAELWTSMTFYSGAADQLPDPTYEAAVGAGNAPAYRTRSCIFFEGLQLGASGQLSNLTFELAQAAEDMNGPIFHAPLGDDVADTIAPLASYDVDSAEQISFDGTWATFTGVVSIGAAAVEYTAPKFSPASVRPITYELTFKGNLNPIAGPFFSLGGSCGVEEFIVQEALDEWNASHYGGWVVAAGYPTYDLDGNPLKLKFSRTYTGGVGMWRVPHFFPGPSPSGADDYGPLDDPDYPYEYKLTGEEAAELGVPFFESVFPASTITGFTVEVGVGTIRIAHYDYTPGPLVWDEQLHYHFFTTYYEESAEIDFTLCTPGEGDPDTDGSPQYIFTLVDSEEDIVGVGFAFVDEVLYLIANINGVMTELGEYIAGVEGQLRLVVNGESDGSVQIYLDDELLRSGASATSFAEMTLHGFGGDMGGTWEGKDLKITMGGPGTIGLTEPTLQEVVERQCERGGLSLDYVDASALSSRTVRAMVLSQLTSPRQCIDFLMPAFGFTCVESDVLHFMWRGGDAVATIPFDDLVAGEGEALPITKVNDIELPCQVFVKFSNVYDDYQDGSEASDRLISVGQNTSVVEFPLGFTPTEAKRIADFSVTDAAASLFNFGPFSLDRSYSALEPGDVVALTAQDETQFRVRLVKKTESAGVLTFNGVSDEASVTVADSVARTDSGGYTNSTGVTLPVDTEALLLDIPILSDAHDEAGFYVVVRPDPDAEARWPGAVIFKSPDDVTYATAVEDDAAAVFGTATTLLATGVVGLFDESSSVTVNVGDGQLYSYTRDEILGGTAPGYAIGADGRWELLYARTATLVGAGVYTLTGLLRGRRGTEWATGLHQVGDVCVRLDPASIARVPGTVTELGIERFYKTVTKGRTGATADGEAFTNEGEGLKPFSPVHVRFARDGSDNATITFTRRTRLACRFGGTLGIAVPLGEASESYELEVWDSAYATLKRTIVATTSTAGVASFAYSAADQTTDFGSAQLTIYVRGYQRSAAVGRGTKAQAQG